MLHQAAARFAARMQAAAFPKKENEMTDYIDKKQGELRYEDFYHGQLYEAQLKFYSDHDVWTDVTGRVTIQDECVYLCQDGVEGKACGEKHGHKFSFTISNQRKRVFDGNFHVQNLKLQSKAPPFHKVKPGAYVNIAGLEDPTDERLMGDFTSDFEFIGVHEEKPLFKVKDNDQSEAYWLEVQNKIKEIGGTVHVILL
jgi:hypothetical protein